MTEANIGGKEHNADDTQVPDRRLSFDAEKEMTMAEPSFRDYFAAANGCEGLTEREKMFIGLAVTLSRGCEP